MKSPCNSNFINLQGMQFCRSLPSCPEWVLCYKDMVECWRRPDDRLSLNSYTHHLALVYPCSKDFWFFNFPVDNYVSRAFLLSPPASSHHRDVPEHPSLALLCSVLLLLFFYNLQGSQSMFLNKIRNSKYKKEVLVRRSLTQHVSPLTFLSTSFPIFLDAMQVVYYLSSPLKKKDFALEFIYLL